VRPGPESDTSRWFLRLDLAVFVVVIAGSVLWIEHGRRFNIEAPTDTIRLASVGAVCPDHENTPYNADCITFMQGEVVPDTRWRVNVPKSTPATQRSGPACPANNENVPYSMDCIRFLSGYFWQPN
jgi:hypothetical protein